MLSKLKTSTLSILFGCVLVTACGTTRGSYPVAPTQVPIRAELRQQCQRLAITQADLPPAASEADALRFIQENGGSPDAADEAYAYAKIVQLRERGFTADLDTTHNAIEARTCALYLELLAVVDAYNVEAARVAAERPH